MALPKKAATTGGKAARSGVPLKAGTDERLRARVEGRTYTPEELDDRIRQLEARLAMLRNKQEQYFLGVERAAPTKERDALKREIDDLKFIVGRNTGLKFQAQSLFNRYLSYERMWLRTEKEIEEGRYHRDIFKARLHAKGRGKAGAEDDGFPEITEEEDVAPPAPPPPPPRPAAAASPGAPSDDRLRAVYQAFVAAKRQCKESVAGLSYEQVAAQLKQQVPSILEQTKAKSIDFKVVIKDGRATLRAVAKD
ncbi:MAG: MXAN_5187 C-terminal domain-containing protein [Myxococcales bacterium]